LRVNDRHAKSAAAFLLERLQTGGQPFRPAAIALREDLFATQKTCAGRRQDSIRKSPPIGHFTLLQLRNLESSSGHECLY
jgi:hypothetical protein